MSEHEKETSEELAQWLSDAGKRTWRKPQPVEESGDAGATETSGDLVRYLEELAGREFRSRDDIRRYLGELQAGGPEATRSRQVVKDTILLLCLLTAFIQYHFLDVSLQISHLPSTVIFVPVDARSLPQRNNAHAAAGHLREPTGPGVRLA